MTSNIVETQAYYLGENEEILLIAGLKSENIYANLVKIPKKAIIKIIPF